MTVAFSSTLDESNTNESWGISDFIIEYYTADICAWGFDAVPTTDSLFGANECLVRCELGQDQLTDFTAADLSAWTFTADTDDVFNTCGDDYNMVGGYGVFGVGALAQLNVNDLPEHNYLSVSFTLFVGDSWDNEYF